MISENADTSGFVIDFQAISCLMVRNLLKEELLASSRSVAVYLHGFEW